jgi:DNA (cytosine-5)-methyltransferase 1
MMNPRFDCFKWNSICQTTLAAVRQTKTTLNELLTADSQESAVVRQPPHGVAHRSPGCASECPRAVYAARSLPHARAGPQNRASGTHAGVDRGDRQRLVTDGGQDARPGGEVSHREIVAVDLFCGAGGFSEGLHQACQELGYDLREAAVNHWQQAIETHEANHPDADQYHSKVEQLHPPEVIEKLTGDDQPGVDLLVGGPECTHFSRARGGKPVSEQKRMSPWHILDWLEKLNVESFVIENVPEIQDWGPVDEDGQPVRDGSIFDAWVNALNQLGYAVDWTQLVASDYGDPTTRERFFIVGQQNGSVTFPDPTHSDSDDSLPDYRTAADIIDWSDLGDSIWTRDLTNNRIHTPPKASTMERIAEGVRRHCDDSLEPFADALADLGRDEIRDLRENRIVDAADAQIVADTLDEPFLVRTNGVESAGASILLRQQDGGYPYDVAEQPVPTIASRGAHAMATVNKSLIMPKNGLNGGLHSNALYDPFRKPVHTITADPRAKLVSPSLVRYSHGGAALDPTDPMPTIATEKGGVFALSNPYLCPLYSSRQLQKPRTRDVNRPLMTIPSSKSPAAVTTPLVRPFIDDYQGPAKSIDEPLNTVETKDRFALCVPELWPWGLDINYRMLQPQELKQAQGFPTDYEIVGTKTDRTEQIGNAVPVNMAKALCKHVMTGNDPSLATFGGGLPDEGSGSVPDYDDVAATSGGASADD